ncbi:MAG: Uma2 family endonuclease [Vicinamibacteria bacterium]
MASGLDTVALRRFTIEEYHRMAETGILGPDERVELVRGVVRRMSPKNWAHVIATKVVLRTMENALRGRASVYQEAPLVAREIDSEPEPHVLVCSNPDELAYRSSRTKPLLVIEVAESSLEYDLGEKATIYAAAGVPEYWVVNLIDRAAVVFRKPVGGSYQVRFSIEENGRVTPEAWPDLSFEVSDFLPPERPASSDEGS